MQQFESHRTIQLQQTTMGRVFELYAQANSATPPSGPTTCGEDALFSFVVCSNEFK